MLSAGRLLGGALKDFVRVNSRVFSMAAEKLASVPEVEIDSEGTFKYVLIKVYGSKKSSDAQDVKTIVRGFKSGKYHGGNDRHVQLSALYPVTASAVMEKRSPY